MILSYAEASAFTTEIAKYMMLASMGLIIFLWAWENLKQYFHWGVQDETDVLIDMRDELVEIRAQLADPQPVDLRISQ